MKTNKFKVWDKSFKKWIPDCCLGDDGAIYVIHSAGNEIDELVNCIAVFSTGLKDDKNGVEIYEGDIVFIPNEEAVDSISGYTRFEANVILAKVVIEPLGVLFVSDELNSDGYISLFGLEDEYCDKEDLEVIGNIYENGELML